MAVSRQVVGIMFTDLVGYSALTQQNEALALELLETHWSILRPVFGAHGGREIKTIGDAFLIEFPSALQAVQAGLAMQAAIAAHNSTAPAERQIRIRIGIHLGDVERRGGDVFGDGVNIASRIEPLAPPGGICISDSVYASVHNKVDVRFHSLGSQKLKNIGQPVVVYCDRPAAVRKGSRLPAGIPGLALALLVLGVLAAIAALQYRAPVPAGDAAPGVLPGESTARGAPQRPVVAVLPLADLRDARSDPRFAEGLHDEILNAVARIPDFDVVSRTSVMSVAAGRPVREIAADLGATHVLEGSLRGNEKGMRIVAQLIAPGDVHLFSWSRDFEVGLDATKTMVDVANDIAARVRFMLRPDDWMSPNAPLSSDPRAVDRYRAGEMAERFDRWGAGLPYFKEALSLDPDFALAHTGTAFSLVREYGLDRGDEVAAHLEKARALAPGLPEIHLVEGWLTWYDGRAEAALDHFRAAEPALNNSVWLRAGKAFVLRDLAGRADDALVEWEAAAAIEPHMFWVASNLGYLRLVGRRYDSALSILGEAQKRWPLSPHIALWRLQTEFARRGDVARLARDMEQMIVDYSRDRGWDSVIQLAVQAAMYAGDYDTALQELSRLQNRDVSWGWGSLSGRYLDKECFRLELLSLAGRRAEAQRIAAAMEPRLAKAAAGNEDPQDLGPDLLHTCSLIFAGRADEAHAKHAALVQKVDALYPTTSAFFGVLQQDLAALAVWNGDHDPALDLLRRSLDAPMGGAHAAVVAVDPVWVPLHKHPDFAALLAAHGQYAFGAASKASM